ncbi:MAG: hypothetical protein WAM28_01835 [Chlamydiales bacterium]
MTYQTYQPAIDRNYRDTGFSKWMDDASKGAEYGWRFFQMNDDFSRLVQNTLSLNGMQEAHIRAGNVAQGFAATASTISATRFIFSWEKFLSGKMFYKNDGEPRSWLLVAVDTLVLAARTLSPFTWLNTLKAIDLGKYAAMMSSTIIGAFSGATVLYFFHAIYEAAYSELGIRECGNEAREAVVASFDLLAFPFQCGFGPGGTPAWVIAGYAVSALSGVIYFANEIYSAYTEG